MVAITTLTGPYAMVGSLTHFKIGFKKLYIYQYRKALIRDRDNLNASVKPILDALKHNHLIIDDDMKNIEVISICQKRATGNSFVRTEIIITDAEGPE